MTQPMNRRTFSAILAAASLGKYAFAKSGDVEGLQLSRNGWMPNNDRLPVLLYRAVFALGDPDKIETAFEQNQWPPQWRNGVYDFIITIRPRMRCSASLPARLG